MARLGKWWDELLATRTYTLSKTKIWLAGNSSKYTSSDSCLDFFHWGKLFHPTKMEYSRAIKLVILGIWQNSKWTKSLYMFAKKNSVRWLHSRKLTCPLRIDGWKMYIFPIEKPSLFRGHVSFPGCMNFFFWCPRLSHPALYQVKSHCFVPQNPRLSEFWLEDVGRPWKKIYNPWKQIWGFHPH